MITYPSPTVCLAHVAPVFLNPAATVDKACSLIQEAAQNGADLIVFPESFLPGFPIWAALQAPINGHDLFKTMAANSVMIEGAEIAAICEAARQNGIFVSLGFSEATKQSVGCLWNANLMIDDQGKILNHHRKLVPTYFEKMIWANGDGAGLKVNETRLGRIGMLICGENTNPLARYSLMAQGEQLHISSYPPIWPTRPLNHADGYNLESAIRIRAGAHSFEAKVFNVVVSACVDDSMMKVVSTLGKEAEEIVEMSPRGVSMVIGPAGEVVSEIKSGEEGLLYHKINLEACVEPKQFHDVVGYYNRFDVFNLQVNTQSQRPVEFLGENLRDGQNNLRSSGEAAKLSQLEGD